jgi:C4-dicarboxylate transporter, DctQ subunit
MNGFDHILARIELIFMGIAAFLLFVMIVTVCFSVIGRYYLDIPAAWTVELSEYIMVALAFLAASWVLQKEGHVRLDIVLHAVNPQLRGFLNRTTAIIATIACALFFWFSLITTIDNFQRDVISHNILIVPKYLVLLPIPLGSLLLTLRYIQKVIHEFKP